MGHALPPVSLMRNPIRDYDWGSESALARFQARTPGGGPEAELWMGAHPSSPSTLELEGVQVPLPELIAAYPDDMLGAAVRDRFGDRLPFLLKVLAIAKPLSVQVHPDAGRARARFGQAGATYVDDQHKPEMLYALEPTEALFGFRPAALAGELIARLGSEALAPLVARLTGPGDDASRLHAVLTSIVTWPLENRVALVAEVAAGCSALRAACEGGYADAFGWVERLVGLYPADPMVIAPLLLDLVKLAPGETVFVPAGVPHCYLSGLGVEILAASDNVVRCGLTSKAVDVGELLEIVDTRPLAATAATVVPLGASETAWRPPVPDFQLSVVRVAGPVTPADLPGPQVLLCAEGSVEVTADGVSVTVPAGRSAFVPAAAGPVTLTGSGVVFRAGPNLP